MSADQKELPNTEPTAKQFEAAESAFAAELEGTFAIVPGIEYENKVRLALHQAVRAALHSAEQSDEVPILKPWDGKPLTPVPGSLDSSLESERGYDSAKQSEGPTRADFQHDDHSQCCGSRSDKCGGCGCCLLMQFDYGTEQALQDTQN